MLVKGTPGSHWAHLQFLCQTAQQRLAWRCLALKFENLSGRWARHSFYTSLWTVAIKTRVINCRFHSLMASLPWTLKQIKRNWWSCLASDDRGLWRGELVLQWCCCSLSMTPWPIQSWLAIYCCLSFLAWSAITAYISVALHYRATLVKM